MTQHQIPVGTEFLLKMRSNDKFFPLPNLMAVMGWVVILSASSLTEEILTETCRKGDPSCDSVHHDKYSKEANVFEVN